MATHSIPVEIRAYGTNTSWTRIDLNPNILGCHVMTQDVEGILYGVVRVPKNYVGSGVIHAVIAANATTGATRLTIGTSPVDDDAESLDCAFTDETAQNITVPATAYNTKLVTFPTSGSLATTIAVDDLLMVRLQHNGTNAGDTLAVDTLVVGLWFVYADS